MPRARVHQAEQATAAASEAVPPQQPQEEVQAEPQEVPQQIEQPQEVQTFVATVYAATGGIIRAYTREVHGDGFEDLAKQMAAQHPGSRIDVH